MNGTAIIALLTFTSSGVDRVVELGNSLSFAEAIGAALFWFVVGLILAIVTSTVAYLNYSAMEYDAAAYSEVEKIVLTGRYEHNTRVNRAATGLARIAIIIGIGSLVAFCIGVSRANLAFQYSLVKSPSAVTSTSNGTSQ